VSKDAVPAHGAASLAVSPWTLRVSFPRSAAAPPCADIPGGSMRRAPAGPAWPRAASGGHPAPYPPRWMRRGRMPEPGRAAGPCGSGRRARGVPQDSSGRGRRHGTQRTTTCSARSRFRSCRRRWRPWTWPPRRLCRPICHGRPVRYQLVQRPASPSSRSAVGGDSGVAGARRVGCSCLHCAVRDGGGGHRHRCPRRRRPGPRPDGAGRGLPPGPARRRAVRWAGRDARAVVPPSLTAIAARPHGGGGWLAGHASVLRSPGLMSPDGGHTWQSAALHAPACDATAAPFR
jgi:hypothetical protein